MANKVAVCPYCLGTKPHQGPTGCPPIQWPPPVTDRPRRTGLWRIDRLHPTLSAEVTACPDCVRRTDLDMYDLCPTHETAQLFARL